MSDIYVMIICKSRTCCLGLFGIQSFYQRLIAFLMYLDFGAAVVQDL